MSYERTAMHAIDRSDDTPLGVVSGLLASDGEASDGHILNIRGGEIPESAPMLFGHDDFSGTRNLGSWTEFEVSGDGGELGSNQLRVRGQIELEGEMSAWRRDTAHMVSRRHINALSVRWDTVGDPISRSNLPSDHPAFVDAKKATGRQRFGMYFEKWRLLEGSVVTLGADPAALIGRMQESQGEVRQFWRSAINYALTEREETAGLVAIKIGEESVYVERAAWESMQEYANERMGVALDTLEAALDAREDADMTLRAALEAQTKVHVAGDLLAVAATPAQETRSIQAATLPAIITPGEVARMLRDALAKAKTEVTQDARAEILRSSGKV